LCITASPAARSLEIQLGAATISGIKARDCAIHEAGLLKFHRTVWTAIWAPKGTPKNIIAKLNAAVVDSLTDSAVRQRLADLGQQVVPRDQQTPDVLAAFQKAEIEKWWPIIKAANITAE
jgi:tripartite-type tricarboxylate transporter receptor subunit TctC